MNLGQIAAIVDAGKREAAMAAWIAEHHNPTNYATRYDANQHMIERALALRPDSFYMARRLEILMLIDEAIGYERYRFPELAEKIKILKTAIEKNKWEPK